MLHPSFSRNSNAPAYTKQWFALLILRRAPSGSLLPSQTMLPLMTTIFRALHNGAHGTIVNQYMSSWFLFHSVAAKSDDDPGEKLMFRRLFSRRGSAEQTTAANHCGIDEDCNYCPQCGDAYRAEIKTCPACSVTLISGSEKLARLSRQDSAASSHTAEIRADDELVTIQKGKLVQLKSMQQLLKAAKVPSMLAGDNVSRG